MSIETDEEAKQVTGLIKTLKILVPFAVSIASVVGVYYAMDNRLSLVEKDLANEKAFNMKTEAKVNALEKTQQAHSVTLSSVQTDLQHIKDDTKETLNLVRTLYRQR
jgi:hypothetical protein